MKSRAGRPSGPFRAACAGDWRRADDGRPQGLFRQGRTGGGQAGRPVFCRARTADRFRLRLRVLFEKGARGDARRLVSRVRKEARAVRRKTDAAAVLTSAATRQAHGQDLCGAWPGGAEEKPSDGVPGKRRAFLPECCLSGKGQTFRGAERRTQRKAAFGAEAPMSWAPSTCSL